jgi:putative endonuclease
MNRRQSAERAGRFAETLAALWLTFKGYRVLARRARTPYGEVDIAALKSGVLVIVEVKNRATQEAALASVGSYQRGRLLRAAQHLGKQWRMGAAPIRLDLMVVRPGGYLRHVRGAFRLDDGAA